MAVAVIVFVVITFVDLLDQSPLTPLWENPESARNLHSVSPFYEYHLLLQEAVEMKAEPVTTAFGY